MPTTADPGDEPPVEVVVLVDGGAGAVTGRAPLGRRRTGRPTPVTGGGPPPSLTGGGAPGVSSDVELVTPAPPPPPRPPRPPRPRRPSRPRGSGLSRHVRVPGTIGLVVIVLALALGTGFVGAYVWARNDAHNIRSTPLTPTTLRRTDAPAETEVTTTTKPDLSADAIAEKVGPSVWSVHTFNSAGQPVQGSAWLTRSAGGQSLLLTSLAVVEASTHQPAPDIVVSGGGFEGKAQLWTWDDSHDLALLIAGGTGKPALPWVSDPADVKVGAKVFVVGGDAKLKPGIVSAVSDQAVEHNVFVDDDLRGGAVVNLKGEVIAVSSAAYTAGGQPTETAFFGVPVRLSCAAVLSCSGAFAGPTTDAGAPPSSTATSTTTP
ncbi:MAG TPA: S1C family serine protease [Acidimicrobiales bacterium]|nr:S1C family serine protease [Acidimicrobiales bacterium]